MAALALALAITYTSLLARVPVMADIVGAPRISVGSQLDRIAAEVNCCAGGREDLDSLVVGRTFHIFPRRRGLGQTER
jgi:hypothetical protein